MENPDGFLNTRNVASGGDGLIANDSDNATRRAPSQSAKMPTKFATQPTPRTIELTYPIHVSNNQRKPRRLNDDEVTPLDQLDTHETYIDCPWCKKLTKTIAKRQSGATTQDYACRFLCTTVVGFMIPYIFGCCQDIAHYCSECGTNVALQQYVYYEGAEGQKPAVFQPPPPPRPTKIKSQYSTPTASLPSTVKNAPQEMEATRKRHQLMASRQDVTVEAGGQPAVEADGTVGAMEVDATTIR